VRHYASLIAVNVPAREERLFFVESGPVVLGVYAAVGDRVAEGDVIAELYRPDVLEQLRALSREQEWALLDLSQLQARLTRGFINQRDYLLEEALLLARLEIIQMKLDYLRRQDEARFVRASMDGVVTQVMAFVPGMAADASHPVATVADQSHYLFKVSGSNAALLHYGEQYTLYFMHEPFTAKVTAAEAGEVYLEIISPGPPAAGDAATATVQVATQEALNAVAIPLTALRRTSLRTFVYVLEHGLRVDRDVDVGVIGNDLVEIVGGLAEGEQVVY
jgi:multidrug efflux pump subunit AcrA (membrane-fusion protein)